MRCGVLYPEAQVTEEANTKRDEINVGSRAHNLKPGLGRSKDGAFVNRISTLACPIYQRWEFNDTVPYNVRMCHTCNKVIVAPMNILAPAPLLASSELRPRRRLASQLRQTRK